MLVLTKTFFLFGLIPILRIKTLLRREKRKMLAGEEDNASLPLSLFL